MTKVEDFYFMIKLNLIIGFLGVGKTSLIKKLIEQKPKEEKWAVLINEFGKVGIDGALLESNQNIQVKEIIGGCVCCSAELPLKIALNQLIRQYKPNRIILEPTGLGHPGGIVDIIKRDFEGVMSLQAVLGLVDIASLSREKVMNHEIFTDQVQLADILIGTKEDLHTASETQKFLDWAKKLFPPKQAIKLAQDINLSDLNQNPEIIRKSNHSSGSFGLYELGLIFDITKVFDGNKLYESLQTITGAERIKGVFNTNQGWVSYNRVNNQATAFFPSSYRKDSRIEIISAYPKKEEKLKEMLEQNLIQNDKKQNE